MITIKTDKEIKKLKYSGGLLSDILKLVVAEARAGVTTRQLDALAEKLIREVGGVPAFKNYRSVPQDPPFPNTICASVNNQLVHGPANDRKMKDGDILSVDIGMQYEGLFTDMAITVAIGKISKEAKKLMKVTKKCLDLAISQVKPGNFVHDISRAVQVEAESNGYAVVKDLVGHGVGYAVHEDPRIPNFIAENSPKIGLKPGMVIAIEPMVSLGTDKVEVLDDGWTVVTADGKLCAHYEHTVAVTERGHLIITN